MSRYIYKLLIFNLTLFILFFSQNNFAIHSLPSEEIVPGGVARIDLDISTELVKSPPEVYFQDKKLLVYGYNGNYFALVGIPLNLKPGKYQIEYITEGGFTRYRDFRVKTKKYKISRIKIRNKNMVNPDPKTQKRIVDDIQKIKSTVNKFSDVLPNQLVLKQPVRGIPTTSFGARRIINGQSKNPHSGMDIAAATATPVQAAAGGKVVLAEKFYLSGNLVAIDHGSGLFTMYAHLSEIIVEVGDQVKTGDKIGRVGSTGRVTGPHLHWSVRVNQTPVNPALFLEKIKHGQNTKGGNSPTFGI